MKAGLTYRNHVTETFRLAWPVILGQLGHVLIVNADTIMIGNIDATNLAAATLANSLFFIVLSLGIGVAMGLSPLTSQTLGAGKERMTGGILEQGLLIAFWLSIVLMALVFGMYLALPYLNQPPEVVGLAQEYLLILGMTIPLVMYFLMYKHFMEGFGDVNPGMVVMGIVVVCNIFFNYLLIYGKLGLPALGLNGAGWATFISRAMGVVIIWAYMRGRERYRKMPLFPHILHLRKRIAAEVLKIGLPTGLQFFFEIGSFSFAVILAGWISKDALAAHQVAISMAAITYMVYSGLGAAASIRCGSAYGAREFQGLRRAGLVAAGMGGILIVFSFAVFFFGRDLLPTLYTNKVEVATLASSLLLIAGFFQAGDGLQVIAMGSLRGMSDVKVPTVITFIAYWGVAIPLGAYLAFEQDWGVQGLWTGLMGGLGFSALFLMIRFVRLSRKSALIRRTAGETFADQEHLHAE